MSGDIIYSHAVLCCVFYVYGYHRDLHVLTHSFPTRRSSDLLNAADEGSGWGAVFERQSVHHRTRSRPARHRLGRHHGRSQPPVPCRPRSEEHTSELQSLMRISYAVFCLKKKKIKTNNPETYNTMIN